MVTAEQLYANTAIVRAALITSEQLAVCFGLCISGEKGTVCLGCKFSSTYKSGSKQSLKKLSECYREYGALIMIT